MGHELKKGSKFATREICTAVFGDSERERARLTRAQAEGEEMKNKERSGELVELDSIATVFRQCMLPVRQRLMALPAEACAHANPSDPQLAREALQRWVDESLPMIRMKLPKS
jgi:hypothetical protein